MTTSYRLYKIDSMTTINASPQIPNAHDIALHVSAQLNESTACVIFTQDLSIIHAQNCTPTPDDLKSLKDAFGDREAAISRGLFLDKTRFEVHRHHPPTLVYGRQMGDADPEASPGIAVCRVEESIFSTPCYAAIVYELPNTSAKMVMSLRNFCDTCLLKTL